MIGQGSVKVDGERVDDRNYLLGKGEPHVIQVGKRKFVRVTLS